MQYFNSCINEGFNYMVHMDLRLWIPALLVAATIGVFCMRGVGQ